MNSDTIASSSSSPDREGNKHEEANSQWKRAEYDHSKPSAITIVQDDTAYHKEESPQESHLSPYLSLPGSL